MKQLNWFKVNIISNILILLLMISQRFILIFDPGFCPDTGMCGPLPPSPVYFLVAHNLITYLVYGLSLIAVATLPILLYKKYSWWRILLAVVVSLPTIFISLSFVSLFIFNF